MLFLALSCYFNDLLFQRGNYKKDEGGEGGRGKASAPVCPPCALQLTVLPSCLLTPWSHHSELVSKPYFECPLLRQRSSRSASAERGLAISLPVPGSKHPCDSKAVFRGYSAFLKTKAIPSFQNPPPARCRLCGLSLPQTDHRRGEGLGPRMPQQPIKVQHPLQAPKHKGVLLCRGCKLVLFTARQHVQRRRLTVSPPRQKVNQPFFSLSL